jgi:hypothetical protein
MVLYFSPVGHQAGSNDWLVYMGKDKFENEDLVKYGWPEDVWCALSSAREMCVVNATCYLFRIHSVNATIPNIHVGP